MPANEPPELVPVERLTKRIHAARMLLGMGTLQARLVDCDGDWTLSDLFNELEARINASRPDGEGVEDCCKCFGDTGLQASTYAGADGVRRCDLCGHPAQPTPPVEVADLCEEAGSWARWLDRIAADETGNGTFATKLTDCANVMRDLIERLSVSSMGRAEAFEEAATVALEQRCERDTPWDRACVTIAEQIRALAKPDSRRGSL